MTSITTAHGSPTPQTQLVQPDLLRSPARTAVALAVIASTYYLGAWLGFALQYPSSMHSVLWPPNAIVLATLLLLPPQWWWLCLVAVFPAHVAIELSVGLPWAAVLGLYVTNTSQALLGATLVHRLSRRHASASSQSVIFIACGVFASPFLLSFADVAVAVLSGLSSDYWDAWRLRFLSNAASTIIFVPPILATARALPRLRDVSIGQVAEALLLAVCFLVLGIAVLFAKSNLGSLLPLVLCAFLPLLLWAAVRFASAGASWSLVALVVITMASATHWPIATSAEDALLMLQAFFVLVSIPILYLAALHEDLRKYVQALDTTTQRYRMATAAGSVGVWDWTPATGELFVDPELKKILGFNDHEIPNQLDAWMRRVDPADAERVLTLAQAHLRGETATFEDEHRMLHVDGSTRWFLARGAVVRDAAGRPVRMLGTDIDVTERRRMADELRGLEVLSRAVLASMNQHVAIVDRAGIIIATNDAWARFGRENAALADRVSSGVNYLEVCRQASDDSDGATALEGITAVLEGSETDFRMEYRCSSGEVTHWFEMSVVPLRLPDGGAVISHRDITHRKEVELEFERQRQEIAHLTRVGILAELSGAMAHELNQPLTTILSNAQAARRILDREPLDLAELRDAVDDIVAADKRAGDVIRRLRTLMRKGDAQFQAIDVNEAIGEIVELAHSDLVVRAVSAICRLEDHLPVVWADRVQLQQVLLNLIMNACEAMKDIEPRERTLTIKTVKGENQDVQICVTDSGGGIPSDLEGRLFEPFVTTKENGLGLGLSICRAIISAHRGHLWAMNNTGGGASFCFSLPAASGERFSPPGRMSERSPSPAANSTP